MAKRIEIQTPTFMLRAPKNTGSDSQNSTEAAIQRMCLSRVRPGET